MAEPKTLDEVLLAFQANLPTLVKDKKGQVGNQKTKYADLVQVNAVVLAELNRFGVTYKTKPTLRAEDPKFVLAYELRHVPSGTTEAGEYPLKLSENPMQMGSAITYARRYVLLALTGVAAEDEDDDGQAASGRYAQRSTQPRQQHAGGGQQTAQRGQRHGGQGDGPPLPSDGAAGLSPVQRAKVMALFTQLGVEERGARLNTTSTLVGRRLGSANELTKAEATTLIDTLEKASKEDDPTGALAGAMATAVQQGGEDR